MSTGALAGRRMKHHRKLNIMKTQTPWAFKNHIQVPKENFAIPSSISIEKKFLYIQTLATYTSSWSGNLNASRYKNSNGSFKMLSFRSNKLNNVYFYLFYFYTYKIFKIKFKFHYYYYFLNVRSFCLLIYCLNVCVCVNLTHDELGVPPYYTEFSSR